MKRKRITAHRALDLLRCLERVRQATGTTELAAVRCAIDAAIDAFDDHVRASLSRRRRP